MLKGEPSKLGLYIINSRQHFLRVMFKANSVKYINYIILTTTV